MNIQKRFHDYYDYALGLGHDESLTYDRNSVLCNVQGKWLGSIWPKSFSAHWSVPKDQNFHSAFAGKGVKIEKDWVVVGSRCLSLFYHRESKTTASSIERLMERINEKVVMSGPMLPDWLERRRDSASLYNREEAEKEKRSQNLTLRHWEEQDRRFASMEWTQAHHELNSPVFLIHAGSGHGSRYVTANPCLKDLDVPHLLPAYEAFQLIEDTLSGVLSRPTNPMAQLDDRSMVKKKGFDPTYGFRRRPGTEH